MRRFIYRSVADLVLIVFSCVFFNSLVFAMTCSSFLDEGVVETPASRMIGEFNGRVIRLEYILEGTGPQSLRQVRKISKQVKKLLKRFEESDLSDEGFDKYLGLLAEFEKMESRFVNANFAEFLAPTDLKRYLYTEEPLHHGFEYKADLQGLGSVTIHISKEVSKALEFGESARTSIFPVLFKGVVGKAGQEGVKFFAGGTTTAVREGVEFKLFELKSIGVGGVRIIGVSGSNGQVYLTKYVSNHHRINYVQKEDFLGHFLRHLD